MPFQTPSKQSGAQIFYDPLKPSLVVGSAGAASGLAFGGLRAVATGRPPIVSALTVGISWFGITSVFWYMRTGLSQAFTQDEPSPRQNLIFSTVAAGFSGGLNATLQRGSAQTWPSTVFCSLLGLAGQASWNGIRHLKSITHPVEGETLRQRIMNSPLLLPFKSISEDEYESLLTERLNQTKADIANVDQKIFALREMVAKTQAEDAAKAISSKSH